MWHGCNKHLHMLSMQFEESDRTRLTEPYCNFELYEMFRLYMTVEL